MRSPLDDDRPSGRLLSTTPTSSATLTPPCSTVRPSTKDSGMPSRTEPKHDRQGRARRLGALGVLAVAAALPVEQPVAER